MLLDNIKVAIRLRPFTNRELEVSDLETIQIVDSETLNTLPPLETGTKLGKKTYKFNWVFDKMSSQKDIFEKTLEYQVLQVLDGYNFTVFSYGAQSSGKTYTLMKINEDYGLLIRSLNKIFQTISSKKRKIQVQFSYLEISNEQLYDLLNNMNTNLDIRDDNEKGVIINGSRDVDVSSTQEVINLIQFGKRQKSIKQHELFIFTFNIQESQGLTNDVQVSKLIFADLGWVERGGQKNQNISLQVLNNCISLLSEAKQKNLQPFIPYRNSKLTRILKESLGGNSKTLMISCISPAVLGFDETIQTLEYSQMSMGIFNQSTMKIIQQNNVSSDYKQIYESLINENNELKKQLNQKQPQYTDKDLVKKYEENIFEHFNNEQDIYQSMFKYLWEIEVLKFKINENQENLQRVDGLDRKKADGFRQYLEQDKKQQESYEEQVIKQQKLINEFNSQRKAYEENIKQSTLSDTSKLYLKNVIEKHILRIQVLEIKHKEQINELQKQEQDRLLAIQRSQISLRDRIIADQKKHIQIQSKNSSLQHFSQVDTTAEVIEGQTAKLKHYPLPDIKDHYFNREAYISQHRREQSLQKQSPRLRTPLQLKDKKPFIPKTPHVRILENLSTPILPKPNPLMKVPPQKIIDSKSMVSLPSIQSNRNLNKFVYDWRGGGYKFLEDFDKKTLASVKELRYKTKSSVKQPTNMDQSFFTTSSNSSPRIPIKQSVLMPGKVHESPYVKGFINKEIQRKMKLHQLNQKMKKVQ